MNTFINVEAERHIVAGMLKAPGKIIPRVKSELISQNHFADFRSRQLFGLVMELFESGRELHIKDVARQPEVLSLSDERVQTDISEIRSKFVGLEAWKSYVPLLKKSYALRKASDLTSEVASMIESGECPQKVASHLSGAAQAVSAITELATSWKSSSESSYEFIEMIRQIHTEGTPMGTPSGIDEIDKHTGGLGAGDLWVIAAPSSCGKTMLMIQVANHFHAVGKNVLVFSLETGAAKIVTRMVSNRLNLDSKVLLGKDGARLDKGSLKSIGREITAIKESDSLTICDNFDLNLDSMLGIATQIKETGRDIDLIVVDYIQLVSLADNNGMNREQQVSLVSRTLKKMAKEHDCPVISASQLNDNGAVRESRAIVQDADVLLKIDPDNGCVHLAKNRDGERGEELPLYMLGKYQRFIHNTNHQPTN